MPRAVVRMKPWGSYVLPGVRNLAITPATKSIRMVQRRLSMFLSPGDSVRATIAEISAFGGRADIKWCCEESPLMTHGGHILSLPLSWAIELLMRGPGHERTKPSS